MISKLCTCAWRSKCDHPYSQLSHWRQGPVHTEVGSKFFICTHQAGTQRLRTLHRLRGSVVRGESSQNRHSIGYRHPPTLGAAAPGMCVNTPLLTTFFVRDTNRMCPYCTEFELGRLDKHLMGGQSGALEKRLPASSQTSVYVKQGCHLHGFKFLTFPYNSSQPNRWNKSIWRKRLVLRKRPPWEGKWAKDGRLQPVVFESCPD